MLHGVEVRDPYRWLEDSESPRVRAWTAAQQARTRAYLDGLHDRAAIAARLRESLDCGALGVVVPRGDWRFFTRRWAGMPQAALYVRDAEGESEERLLVDPAPLSPDAATALDWWYPSDDGELVAYGISEAGTEDSVLHVLETGTGRVREDRIPRCRLASVAFEPGNRALLYTRLPLPGEVPEGEEHYHGRVFRHVLGTDSADDALVFAREDKTHYPGGISFSADGRWTVVNVSKGWAESAVALRDGDGTFRVICELPETYAWAWFAGDRLLAVTDLDAPNSRLVEIDPLDPAHERWRTIIPESEHVLVDARATADRLLVHHLVSCASRVSIHAPDGTPTGEVPLPPLSTVTGIGTSARLAEAFLAVEEFTRPAAVHRLREGGRLSRVLELRPPAGFDPSRYPVRQAWCVSSDGTRVPMFLVGRASGHGPAVLTGYGGFNISRTPAWTPTAVPFLEAGGLLVFANLRGGSEFGEEWHKAGSRANKQHCFDDFVAAGEWLVEQGLTSPARLGIMGRSNGGLLVGAAMTQRPDLWGAVWCGVPLLDMVRYERFQVAQLWAAEYGSASEADEFGWLLAYSPYHHVEDGVAYPPTLLTTGEEDTRVDPMHARKMAARLQAASPGTLTLLRVEERAGHGQGKPVGKLVEEEADAWAFLLHTLSG